MTEKKAAGGLGMAIGAAAVVLLLLYVFAPGLLLSSNAGATAPSRTFTATLSFPSQCQYGLSCLFNVTTSSTVPVTVLGMSWASSPSGAASFNCPQVTTICSATFPLSQPQGSAVTSATVSVTVTFSNGGQHTVSVTSGPVALLVQLTSPTSTSTVSNTMSF